MSVEYYADDDGWAYYHKDGQSQYLLDGANQHVQYTTLYASTTKSDSSNSGGNNNIKGKAKESKTKILNRLYEELNNIQQELDEVIGLITRLEPIYEIDATSRKAYQKSTYNELSKAYDKQSALKTEYEQKRAEYDAAYAKHESSSGEESPVSKSNSGSSRKGSSGSSAPAEIGWDCGTCSRSNHSDPWGPDNMCGCGHVFCGDDDHCTVQWNP